MSTPASAHGKRQRRAYPALTVALPAPLPATVVDDDAEVIRRRLLRLALDVHDGPMQNLTVIGFSLGELRRRIAAVVPTEHQQKLDHGMEQISAELGKVESDLRALIEALESGVTERVPLREAIEAEIREFERRATATVTLSFDDDVQVETDSQRIALQSVTRAALTNIAKHARAANVVVRLRSVGETITLEIEDDGVGFRADRPPKAGRFGLVGMRERIELLGGELRVTSSPGGPTTIAATLRSWCPPDGD